jgi:hypothetical protein
LESENKKIGNAKLRKLTYLFFFAAFFFFAAMEIRLLNVNVIIVVPSIFKCFTFEAHQKNFQKIASLNFSSIKYLLKSSARFRILLSRRETHFRSIKRAFSQHHAQSARKAMRKAMHAHSILSQ